MGLISARDEHNRRGDDALAGLDNVRKIVEDVITYDRDFTSHVNRVRQVFGRCAEHGIPLNRKKFFFAVPEVSYCGFKVSASGYTPDDHLVAALQTFPVPTNRAAVQKPSRNQHLASTPDEG